MTPRIVNTVQAPYFDQALEKALPPVRGRLIANAPLRQFSWLGVGGPAEVLFKPEDADDLTQFVKVCPADVPITVLGLMSNVIIRDGGIPGVVVRLGRDFAQITAEGTTLRAGAAAMDVNVALFAAQNGIAGLEFLSGVPGSVGGALRMNAGAYGTETKDVLDAADVLFRDGTRQRLTAAQMNMTYRRNGLPDDVIFLGATFQGRPGVREEIEARMMEIKTRRAETQPIRTKTGGSTFANPVEGEAGYPKKAWELIDAAGCRGLTVGGAQMSDLHCNFMINTGDATAADLEGLGEEVRRRVRETSGADLRWEVKRIGTPLNPDR